jgi:hypothetical protein
MKKAPSAWPRQRLCATRPFLRRWAGNDLGLKGGKPRRLDAGSDRGQLGKKQMLSGRVVTALVRDRFAGEE